MQPPSIRVRPRRVCQNVCGRFLQCLVIGSRLGGPESTRRSWAVKRSTRRTRFNAAELLKVSESPYRVERRSCCVVVDLRAPALESFCRVGNAESMTRSQRRHECSLVECNDEFVLLMKRQPPSVRSAIYMCRRCRVDEVTGVAL